VGKAFLVSGEGGSFHVFFREESLVSFGSFCQKLPGDRILLCVHFGTWGFPVLYIIASLLFPYFLFLIPVS
jgi:hypothetical protein